MSVEGMSGLGSVHIIGVSIPRSGHNFVVRLLQDLFPRDLFYCEYYDVPGCCQAIPCARRGTQPISFQKTHDLELNVARDIPNVTYLIMHRSPAPAILSARELYAEDYGEDVASDRGEYAVWLGRQAEYYVTFSEHWLNEPPADSVVMDYDDLAADPAQAVQQILDHLGIVADQAAIHQSVIRTSPHGGLFGERPYVPRSIEKSRYLDRELVAIFESIVVDQVPFFAARRVFEPVEYRGSLTHRVFEALRAARSNQVSTAIALLDNALGKAPDNALLHYERASLAQLQGRFDEAQAFLQRAALLFPTHRPILESLATVALAAGDAASAADATASLMASSEPTLANRLRLALFRTHDGDETAAQDVLAEVEREQPDDAAIWRLVSEIKRSLGDFEGAAAAIETAIRLAPLHGELYAFQADLLLECGRPTEAIAAVRGALAISPIQRDWWLLLVDAHLAARDPRGALSAVREATSHVPRDARLDAALARARRQVPGRNASPRRLVGRPAGVRSDRWATRVRVLRSTVSVRPHLNGSGAHGAESRVAAIELERLSTQLTQVRAALGVAERRLYETEVTKQRQLEEAWEQARELSEDLALQDDSRKAAWQQARALTNELNEKELAMQEAWRQADVLASSLEEQGRAAEAAWEQAHVLNDALQEKDADAKAAWEQANALNDALQLHVAEAQSARDWAQILDDRVRHRHLAFTSWRARAETLEQIRRKLRDTLEKYAGAEVAALADRPDFEVTQDMVEAKLKEEAKSEQAAAPASPAVVRQSGT